MISSVTTEDNRIKVNLKSEKSELDDNTGVFISPDGGDDGLSNSPNASYDWYKIAKGGLTDFSSSRVNMVMVLIYKKTDKGVWWDYFQQSL